MYGIDRRKFQVVLASRDEVDGVPVERYDIPIDNVKKEVLLVVRVGESASGEVLTEASAWMNNICKRLTTSEVNYSGITLYDNDDFKIDLYEVKVDAV